MRIFIDGFEAGSLLLWDEIGDPATVAAGVEGMDGGYCADLSDSEAYISRSIAAIGELYMAFRWRCTAEENQSVLTFYSGSEVQCSLKNNFGFVMEAWRGNQSTGTLLATGVRELVKDTTYLVEVHVKIDDSSGVFAVKIDGLSDIAFSGDTKHSSSSSTVDKIRLGYNTYYYGYQYFDNVVLDDAGWIGETFIQVLVPNAAGNDTDWSPSAGDNYACVDEVPASEDDYVFASAAGKRDLYNLASLSGTISSVLCVQAQSTVKKTGTPAGDHLKLAVRTGGEVFYGDSEEIPTETTSLLHVWELNPDTEAAWQTSEVNALQAGFETANS